MEMSADLVLQTAVIGLCLAVLVLLLNRLRSTKEENVQRKPEKKEKKVDHHTHTATKPAAAKKKQEKWAPRESKQAFTHPWMLTSLKGHTGEVLDMDFSGNSKFLATCADDLEVASTEDGSPGDCSGNSSSSEGNKENKRPPDSGGGGTPKAAARSRRQKKNASPGKKNKAKGKRVSNVTTESSSKQAQSIPLRQRAKLKLTDNELAQFFLHYVLSPDQLLGLSFPVESTLYPGRAIIFKTPSSRPQQPVVHQPTRQSHLFDVNAQEFVPKFSSPFMHTSPSKASQAPELSENIYVSSSLVSNGTWQDGSSDSDSTKSEDFVKHKEETKVIPSPVKSKAQEELSRGSDEKWCVRCGRGFFVSNDGEYLTQEKCLFHWGKLQIDSNGVPDYSCCKGRSNSKGCTTGKLHVWKGINDGINGPLDGFVRTRARKTVPPDGNYGIYALDCEMCFTTNGLELIKVTVVGTDGRLVYDSLVKPEHYIIDYNTRFSGITAKDLNKRGATKSLKDVQNDLMGFINADTILIGHGLENDLRALRIIHGTVIDTSVVFPHYYGLPYRRSLKSLANCLLKREIQSDSSGHDSYEDARACIELMLWRIRKEFRSVLEGHNSQS